MPTKADLLKGSSYPLVVADPKTVANVSLLYLETGNRIFPSHLLDLILSANENDALEVLASAADVHGFFLHVILTVLE